MRLATPGGSGRQNGGQGGDHCCGSVNPDSATRKAIYYPQQQGKTVLQIVDYPEC